MKNITPKQYINIYVLEVDGIPYYVGKTVNPINNRLSGHICSAKASMRKEYRNGNYRNSSSKVNSWLISLLRNDKLPTIRLIERFDFIEGREWEDREKFWIRYFRDILGFSLKNLAEGGKGSSGYKMPVESVKKKADNLRGIKRLPEIGRKISASKKGVLVPEERRDRIAKTLTEKVGTPLLQFTKDGKFVKRFPSLKSAWRETGIDQKSIAQVAKQVPCFSQNKITGMIYSFTPSQAGGFIWKYESIV